jgi:hexulose-6-phosphate isomerase
MKVSIRVGFGTPEEEGEHPFEPTLKGVSELGFDGIELMLRPGAMWGPRRPQPWSPTLTKEDRAEMVGLAQQYGVEISTLSADWAWGYAQYCPHIDHWDRGVEILKGDIELAHDLGAKAILVHFGASQSQDWDQVKGIARQLAEEGERQQIKVGFEGGIFARIGLGGLEALARLIDEVDSPWFGAYEHCYWPRGQTQPHEEIELFGSRIVCLHSGRMNFEDVDYEKMSAALRKAGYDWYWVFEVPWSAAEESKQGFDRIMASYW